MAKSKAPSGLSISRSKNTFKLTWKKPTGGYADGQRVQRRQKWTNSKGQTKYSAWTSIKVSTSATSASYVFPTGSYCPNATAKCKAVQFRVRGNTDAKKNDPAWSAWASKSFAINPPRKPSGSVSRGDTANTCTYSWNVSTSNTDAYPFTRIEYQSVLVASNTTDGSKITFSASQPGWRSGTSSNASGSISITEDTAELAKGSRTRWVRFRSVGIGGHSDWYYVRHVYATPYTATIDSYAVKDLTDRMAVTVYWTSATDAAHPIDETTVEYAVGIPESVANPGTLPWDEAATIKDTSGSDGASFEVPEPVPLDNALFVRVKNKHDDNYSHSTPTRVFWQKLKAPTLSSAVYADGTKKVTVQVAHNSDYQRSFVIIQERPTAQPGSVINIGGLNHDVTSGTFDAPGDGEFGAVELAGSWLLPSKIVGQFTTSDTVWSGVAPAPAPGITVTKHDNETALVSWDWSWAKATSADIAWSKRPFAWDANEEPDTVRVTTAHTSNYYITGLDEGAVYYFRVRLVYETEDAETPGAWSTIATLDLAQAPAVPQLTLSAGVAVEGQEVTASWTYATNDGTAQVAAEVFIDGVTAGVTATAQHIDLTTAGLSAGNHEVTVQVTSGSGMISELSDPAILTIAEPLNISIAESSLVETTVEDETAHELRELPLTVTPGGVTDDMEVTVIIERTQSYYIERPDGDELAGHEGETVALIENALGDEATAVTVDLADLIGRLDDGAPYRLIITAENGLGQTASAEQEFTVAWTVQPEVPSATVEIDGNIARITPEVTEGETADIYRLTADRPELVARDVAGGTVIVDPYPPLNHGGYRVVAKTANGDYITAEAEPAWIDIEAHVKSPASLIDFDGETVEVLYNQNINSNFDKDFEETAYLGGSVVGDWNRAAKRSATVTSYVLKDIDREILEALRRLALFPEVAHIRTIDGSSFDCDIQVAEDRSYDSPAAQVSLKVTRVDQVEPAGQTLEEWEGGEPVGLD